MVDESSVGLYPLQSIFLVLGLFFDVRCLEGGNEVAAAMNDKRLEVVVIVVRVMLVVTKPFVQGIHHVGNLLDHGHALVRGGGTFVAAVVWCGRRVVSGPEGGDVVAGIVEPE